MTFVMSVGADTQPVEVIERDGRYRVRIGNEWLEVDARALSSGGCSLLIGGASYVADLDEDDGEIVVTIRGEAHRVRIEEGGRRLGRRSGAAAGSGQRLVAPMPGRVVAVHVRPGDRVEADAPLVVLEAMKMENEFRSTSGGVVAEVHVAAGQAVNAGDLLVVVTTEGAPSAALP